MTTVIDKNGKRTTRSGVLQDGDTLVVPMRMMDATDPGLVAAAALAQTVKRNEAFDYAAAGHRPGYVTQARDEKASQAADDARGKYHGLTRDAWKNPPALVTDSKTPDKHVSVSGTNNEQRAAVDVVIASRDKRTSEAWRS